MSGYRRKVPGGKAKRQVNKVKRSRAEETQEYVREAKDLSQEEAEDTWRAGSAFRKSPCFGVTIDAVKNLRRW